MPLTKNNLADSVQKALILPKHVAQMNDGIVVGAVED
jgi:hypothetical protein